MSRAATWARAELFRSGLEHLADSVAPSRRLVAFKGISIVFGQGGAPALRTMADADALVVDGSLVGAVRIAASLGWGVRWDDITCVMTRSPNGAYVDLHGRVLPPLVGAVGNAELRPYIRAAQWSRNLFEFDTETQAVIALAHLAKDRFVERSVSRCVLDLKILVDAQELKAPKLIRRAQSLGLSRMVAAALWACGRQSPWVADWTGQLYDARRAELDVGGFVRDPFGPLSAVRYRWLDDCVPRAALATTVAAITRPVARLARSWR